jgi:Putative metallopeptidase
MSTIILCLAYGADPVLFADVVEMNYLPKERARLCRGQYGELNYAFHQLILPDLDRQLANKSWISAGFPPTICQACLASPTDVAATEE